LEIDQVNNPKKTKINVGFVMQKQPADGGGYGYENNLFEFLSENYKEQINLTLISLYKDKGFKKKSYRVNFFTRISAAGRSNIFLYEVLRFTPWSISSFERMLKKKSIDLVYFPSPNALALDLKEIPFISTVWDLGHLDLPDFPETSQGGKFEKRDYFYERTLRKSLLVSVDSSETQSRITSQYRISPERIVVTGLLPRITEHVCERGCRSDDYFYYPAQFWPHKNHAIIIEAVKLLSNRFDFKVVFTGSDKGNLANIKQLAEKEGIENFFEFLGFVDQDKKSLLYFHSKAVLMPSLLGPTNLPPQEAALYGKKSLISEVHAIENEVLEKFWTRIPRNDSRLWALEMEKILLTEKVLEPINRNYLLPKPDVFDRAIKELLFNTQLYGI
jgi:glycosyltransferase involved in cell wall biosynthesis